MSPELQAPVAFGVILGLATLLAPARHRVWWLGLPVVAVVLAAVFGLNLQAGGLAGLPWEETGSILAWLLLGHCARVAGGPVLPRSWGLVAALAGWLMGDLGAAALLAGLIADRGTAIRAALVASAAALISPIGTPVSLVVVDPAYFGPLPIFLALVAWPVGALPERQGRVSVSLILGSAAALVAWIPSQRLIFLAAAAALLAFLARKNLQAERFPAGEGVFAIAAGVLAWGARHGGLSRELLAGLELLQGALPDAANGLFATAGVLLGLLMGETAGAPLIHSMLGASANPPDPAMLSCVAAGLAVGGLGPLLMVWRHHPGNENGSPRPPFWREALRPYLMQVVVVVAWAAMLDDLLA